MLDMGARTANQFIVGLLHRNGKVESAEREIIFLGNKLRQSESLNGLLETELWKHRGNVGPNSASAPP
jgi:hypothetical protein